MNKWPGFFKRESQSTITVAIIAPAREKSEKYPSPAA
jgi:hypothetical protein